MPLSTVGGCRKRKERNGWRQLTSGAVNLPRPKIILAAAVKTKKRGAGMLASLLPGWQLAGLQRCNMLSAVSRPRAMLY